ncbi:SEC-C domain-containing protein [Patescibacteria group bacterium]|nr:SEC-C domain-containing protein [Patescibacteria group bacterium]
MSLKELLDNKDIQSAIIKNAEGYFDFEKVFKEPTVVFDKGVQDFWTTTMNSPRREKYLRKIDSGDIIPINADLLNDFASVHSVFHAYLSREKSLPMIPTVSRLSENSEPFVVGNYDMPKEIPGLYIKKISYQDNQTFSHGGEGVSLIFLKDKRDMKKHFPRNMYEFLQPFIVPPDEYVRDIRVYLVGGQPIAGLVRRALKPLLPENFDGKIIPTKEQYPSAQCPGPKLTLEENLKDKVFIQAKKVADILDKTIRQRKRSFSPYSTFGFGSVDFLLDAEGTPLPVDFDLNPSVTDFEDIDKKLAQSMADFLKKCADVNNGQINIFLIGHSTERFLSETLKNLRDKLPEERIIFKPTIIEKLTKDALEYHHRVLLKEEKKLPKPGRNQPCPCGSGRKYKKCCLPKYG